MNPVPAFQPYGIAHLSVIFLTIALPFLFAGIVRATKSGAVERAVVILLSAGLILNYAAYLIFIRRNAPMPWQNTLPLQLCDWGMFVIIVAMWRESLRWLEVAYFWGIGGTLQAVLTPNLHFGFPDFRFFSFFLSHSGMIIGVIFLMLIRKYRPRFMSIFRVFAWSELYFVVTLIADEITGVNYGFLLHKPEAFSILNFLADWRPLYLFQLHILALLFFVALYLPFAIVDLVRKAQTSTS
ncbi:MAG: hypothetical protein QOI04_2206 [Verrucomicrobiota bacterium]|jgi:hypothetical integral membrane protein (TIGR02206 family)